MQKGREGALVEYERKKLCRFEKEKRSQISCLGDGKKERIMMNRGGIRAAATLNFSTKRRGKY
jgi:hypothetical protein